MVAAVIQNSQFELLHESIAEGFRAIGRFEAQLAADLVEMRDKEIYKEQGHETFADYCEERLVEFGGSRRIYQLLASYEIFQLSNGRVTKEAHARPLIRLRKEPEKLAQAVERALQGNPNPTQADFAAAAEEVSPRPERSPKTREKEQTPFKLNDWVAVNCEDHVRHAQEGVIAADAPNRWQQIVSFPDGEREMIHKNMLVLARTPQVAKTYTEDEVREIISRTIAEASLGAKAGVEVEAETKAEAEAARRLARQYKEKAAQLQIQVDELESLRSLESENKNLQDRIAELERLIAEKPPTRSATSIDVGMLATTPIEKGNHRDLIRLAAIALSNINDSQIKPDPEVNRAVSLVLGCDPKEVPTKKAALGELGAAVKIYREKLSRPDITWDEMLPITQKYTAIKNEIWGELYPAERNKIKDLIVAYEDQKKAQEAGEESPAEYQKYDNITLAVRGNKFFVVHPDDAIRYSAEEWLDALEAGKVQSCYVCLTNIYHKYNIYHGEVVGIRGNGEMNIKWQEDLSLAPGCQWYHPEELIIKD